MVVNSLGSSPRMTREMVQIVVCEMIQKGSCISKRNSTEVAIKTVAKYSKYLQDVIDRDVIGPGYHSLFKQMRDIECEEIYKPRNKMKALH